MMTACSFSSSRWSASNQRSELFITGMISIIIGCMIFISGPQLFLKSTRGRSWPDFRNRGPKHRPSGWKILFFGVVIVSTTICVTFGTCRGIMTVVIRRDRIGIIKVIIVISPRRYCIGWIGFIALHIRFYIIWIYQELVQYLYIFWQLQWVWVTDHQHPWQHHLGFEQKYRLDWRN